MTITDEELASLPDDPTEKFIALVALARPYEEAASDSKTQGAALRHYRTFLSIVLAAAKELEARPISDIPFPRDDDSVFPIYTRVQAELDEYILRVRIRNAASLKVNSVRLEAGTKQKLRHHLEQMRAVVEASNLTDAKKERLYSRIAALQLEIDKDRTRMEAFGGFAVEFATATEPLIKVVEEIAKIFGYAKEQEDKTARLPAPDKPKQIEHKPEAQPDQPQAGSGKGGKGRFRPANAQDA